MTRQIRFPVLVGLSICAASLGAEQADTVRNPLASDPAAALEGQRVYNATCQTCHGPSGQGDRDRGTPALSAGALARGNEDAELFRSIRGGIPGTQMPPFPRLTDEQIWQIISYIRTLQGSSPAAADARAPVTPVEGDANAGEALFFEKAGCASCHEVNARGGVTGPDLSNAGRLAPALLRQKILEPNVPLPPAPGARGGGGAAAVPVTIAARLPDGREIRGVRRNEDTYTLQMVDTAGTLHLLEKMRLASITVENRSLMPGDYASRLTSAEITDLVAYLHRQRERDLTRTVTAPITGGVGYDRLRNAQAEPQNWLMYWGDYHGTHSSRLNAIDTSNVHRLRTAWAFPVLGGNSVLEGTPLVADGVMYVTGSGNPATVAALDARTGRQIWRWTRQQKIVNPYEINPFSRGAAILGNRIFVGTLDAVLIAIDARTGRTLWEVQVADTLEGYSITSPPLVIKDKVITGIAGGEYATRGFIDAYDAATGKRLWRFYTIPGPGEPHHETWKGESWKTGGGATWLTGTYDPDLNTIYWPVGNPAPMLDRSVRGELDNLYTDSVVALDADTGTLKWHYQFTPNDGHDWDSVQDMVLVDRMWRGQQRKLLLHADRNGHFYVLDRTNGRFLSGTPFIYQNWNKGFDDKGRPQQVPGSNSSPEGSFLVYPTLGGATNFQAPSYSALTGWFYLAYSEAGQQYTSAPSSITRGQQYTGGGRGAAPPARRADQPAPNAGIKALDPETGRTMWDFKIFQGSITNGVLATGGGVLFASTRDGNISALDAKTGKYLWHFQTGGNHAASPISYAVGGRQYVALSAGNVIFSFALPD
jgi:PQQ-dependent dehydrogenase (methanol/ethanol family)